MSEHPAEDQSDLVITSVRLPRAMRDELEQLASRYRYGRSGIIREAIEAHLAQLRPEEAA